MNKSQCFLRSIVAIIAAFSFILVGSAYAASTIGTNMSTTGTFTQTVGSATAARFQDAAGGINALIINTTNTRVGVGAVPGTTFEVQGTASASYFLTGNSLQVAGFASVAYSRFGTGATGHTLAAVDDVLFTGLTEFDDNAFFDAKASVSGNFQTGGRFVLGDNGDTGEINTSVWDISNAGVGSGFTGFTTTGNFSGATASLSGNLQTSGRFIADTAASHSFAGDLMVNSHLIVGATVASNSGATYIAEFGGSVGTATVSLLFGSSTASSKGTCLQLKDSAGNWVYARVISGGSAFTINAVSCH